MKTIVVIERDYSIHDERTARTTSKFPEKPARFLRNISCGSLWKIEKSSTKFDLDV